VTTFKKSAAAEAAFSEITSQLPSTATATLFGDSLIVGLPAEDNHSREEWFEKLQQRSTNLFVLSSNSAVTLSLSFVAPTKTAAMQTEEDLHNFFARNGIEGLIPPWDPVYDQPDFAAYRDARRVWREIQDALEGAWKDTNVTSYASKIAAAQQRGAREEIERLLNEKEKRAKSLRDSIRENFRTKYATTRFAPLVDLEAELTKTAYTNRQQRASIASKIAEHLGARENLRKVPSGFGGVTRNGLLLEVGYISLQQPDASLPQLLNWLCQRNSAQIRYTFHNFSGFFGEDDD
jgi:hypothetical protein